jgi:DNA-binding NarL/FixJ family response regulator
MKKDIQILLVDDHQVVRDGLQHMLGREEDMEIVGQSGSSEEALSQLEKVSPNVVLMDIKMPGEDGIEVTRRLLEKKPSCKVIMLTLYDEYLAEAMEAGAMGYLLKDIKRAELVQAIRQVHNGQIVISENIAPKSWTEYEEKVGNTVGEYSLPGQNDSGTMLEEVQMVIPPPVNAKQLIKFVSRVEEMLQSRTLQMVGSWEGGTAITIPLPKPATLEIILEKVGEMSEVETIGEKPLAEAADPGLLKKTKSLPRLKNKIRKTIFVTLNNS